MNSFTVIPEQSKWIALGLNRHTISSYSVRTVSVDCGVCGVTMSILHSVGGRRVCVPPRRIEGSSVIVSRALPGTGSREHAAGIPETSPANREFLTVNIFEDEWLSRRPTRLVSLNNECLLVLSSSFIVV